MEKFTDRADAGKALAKELQPYAKRYDVIILALPRGGVPVAYEIAVALSLPMDVFIVRKLGVPGHEELALGAIATGGAIVFNQDIIDAFHISQTAIEHVIHREQQEMKRRETTYRNNRPLPDLSGKTVILVDDGIATGATMKAVIKALDQYHPASVIIAVPVAAKSSCEEMKLLADKIVCLLKPQYFNAVGAWYQNFPQTSDAEVSDLMGRKSAL